VASLILRGEFTAQAGARSESFDAKPFFERMPINHFHDRARAFVKIQDGCESFCSYCIVPYARGPCRSLPAGEVISQLISLDRGGYKEAVLTGIHLGKYGVDLPGRVGIVSLLREIGLANLSMRIRLSSLEPNEIGHDLIRMVETETWLCPHFHIPLQSGDDRVLRKMNRTYRARAFARLVESIHHIIPRAAIGADVMCGFPGESESAHRGTLSLVEDLPLSYLHVFPYSKRKGTPAWGFEGQVEDEVVKRRAAEMRAAGQRKRADFYKGCLGECFSVVAEDRDPARDDYMKGTSDNYIPVRFKANPDKTNRVLKVRMDKVAGAMIEGTVC
jgi:threonylcarbamoyladenosine tRNA methylthiotransferase MtaB